VSLRQRAWDAVCEVTDPEIPVLTIADLGVLRDILVDADSVQVVITPTYSGCPAMHVIALEIELALARAAIPGRVTTVLSPAWTTAWMTQEGRRKLREYGIAPPADSPTRGTLFGVDSVTCPHCGAADTELLAAFGSTACKSLRRCLTCREAFDHFKCH
jgi:ring-1,2-phenylacetyl-CoA epoxidase subunit PaaD